MTPPTINNTSKPTGLYVHVPFCRSRCSYCDFHSSAVGKNGVSDEIFAQYLQRIFYEAERDKKYFSAFSTLYIGGGTPSLLTISQLASLMDGLQQRLNFESNPEITIEANPIDLQTKQKVQAILSLGFTRISLGIQSFDNQQLLFLDRLHDGDMALKAMEHCRNQCDNVSIDLIFDLPKQTPQLWLKDLQTALQFCPDHFSCYTLTWAESAPLGQILTEENFPSSASSDHSLLDLTHRELETKGYPAYEVCSFSPSKEKHSRHNQLYWNYSPYLGLGPSAASFQIIDDQYVRWTSEPQLSSSPQIPQIEKEILTYENRLLEQLFLGLRTTAGISLDSLYSLFPNDFSLHAFPLLSDLQKNGTFCVTSSHLTPTRKGIFLADGLAMDFFQLLSPFLKN